MQKKNWRASFKVYINVKSVASVNTADPNTRVQYYPRENLPY